jgi:predicted transposase YdaD
MKELTRKYNNIQKEVGELMSGAMIQTEARRLRDEGLELGRNEGRIEGRNEGRIEGSAQMLIKMGREYGIDDASLLDRLRKELGISPERAAEYLDKYGKPLV